MDYTTILLASVLFLLIAFLYSSVGHAGASGYLAIMALLSFPVESIKPVSLVLNIVVSAIATYKFIKAGYFDKKIFLLFAITSIPMAFVGGYLTIDVYWFKILAGLFLILSGILLLVRQWLKPAENIRNPPLVGSLLIGAVIGLFSGLIGVGGGIFLSPIIIIMGYTSLRNTSGVAALFILCNSIIGLAGHYASLGKVPAAILYWIVAVVIGGLLGAHYGSRKFNNKIILLCLCIVLLSAGVKFLVVG
ncbi:MAG: sulfite exporter TauE/SafE family protein [Cyclobacteriaceae bacterium]|nr:sulfite exporter TauE/SafE family protein [Cyclobacteriaceae bacterium]